MCSMHLLMLHYAPFPKVGDVCYPHDPSTVYSTWVNAIMNATLSTVREMGDARAETGCIDTIYCLAFMHISVATAPSVKYDDVL